MTTGAKDSPYYWTYGPSSVWPEGSPNRNYAEAMDQLVHLMMHDDSSRFRDWFRPEQNGELDIYLEFSRSRPPTKGAVRKIKNGYRYSRRFPHDVLRGLTKEQIAATAAAHLVESLTAITRRLALDDEPLPSESELLEVASRSVAPGG